MENKVEAIIAEIKERYYKGASGDPVTYGFVSGKDFDPGFERFMKVYLVENGLSVQEVRDPSIGNGAGGIVLVATFLDERWQTNRRLKLKRDKQKEIEQAQEERKREEFQAKLEALTLPATMSAHAVQKDIAYSLRKIAAMMEGK